MYAHCFRDSKSDDDDDDEDDNDDCYNGGPESNDFNSLDSNQNASGKTTPSDHSLSGIELFSHLKGSTLQ